ncbi:DUF5642 family protein [Mycolicibacterium sp.]|uniref:DUF5642 family protein n=1 Tax=Mycolicibacterium sp. TaxID=2320850 RepID=UPI0037C919C3
MRNLAVALGCAAALAGCRASAPTADIAKITDLKSSFGPQFALTEVPPTGIDPKFLTGQKLPDGLTFEPPACAKFAAGQLVPTGTQGNMAAVSAEGEGNRFIVIAVQTNEPVPVTEPGADCRKVAFGGGAVRGTVEAVEVPTIDGATTLGVHRVVQTVTGGKPRTGEVFNYSAHFGDYQVIVSANPLVLPNKPTAPVNTQRARDLLIAGVNAIRN